MISVYRDDSLPETIESEHELEQLRKWSERENWK
jgi:hypothetical protein